MRFLRLTAFILIGLLIFAALGFATLYFFNPTAPKVVLVDPSPDGERIETDLLLANYYQPQGEGRHAGVLLLGGSEGGLGEGVARVARALRDQGYAVLHVSYFRGPGQAERLELIPLELFDRATDWLAARPEVDPARLAIIGGSKGAEAALLVAARREEFRAVVAGMPSSVVWQGIDWNIAKMIVDAPGSSWSVNGEPVPYLPYGRPSNSSGAVQEFYVNGLKALANHQDAVIPVEAIAAPVLLVCGEDDQLWPSCPMADEIVKRSVAMQGPAVEALRYPDAGHAVFGLPLDESDPNFAQLGILGGSPAGNNAARKDAWPKILAHLEEALGASGF